MKGLLFSSAENQKYLAIPTSTSAPLFWTRLFTAFASLLFIVLCAVRLFILRSEPIKARLGYHRIVKVFINLLFFLFQLTLLINCILSNKTCLNTIIVSGTLSAVAALGICILSFIEHARCIRPSDLVVIYILAILASNLAEILVISFQKTPFKAYLIITTHTCLALLLLVSESRSKSGFLKQSYQTTNSEQTSGIIGRTLFFWINSILLNASRNLLSPADFPSLEGKLSSEQLCASALRAWNARTRPESRLALPLTLLKSLSWFFIAPVLPRLLLILFRYSQAVLINLTIRFINSDYVEGGQATAEPWLILAALLIYVGIAVSTSMYQHSINRLRVAVRGCLIELIYQRSLCIKSDAQNDGNAVTLMSTDVDNLDTVGEMFHETWAQVVEVIVGTALLWNQIGWFCIVPLCLILLCSQMSRYVAKHLRPKQKAWSVATQERIAAVISLLGSIKSVKMMGIIGAVKTSITVLRGKEISTSKQLRWIMVAYNATNALGIFTPVVTLAAFAIFTTYHHGRALDSEIVFTTIAILAMVTHPANMVMTIVPRVIASLANFERIHHYLIEDSRFDARLHTINYPSSGLSPSESRDVVSKPILIIEDMAIQNNATLCPILENINLTMMKGSLIVCSGRVGTGKSALCRAILGEFAPTKGSISCATKRMGYCAQVPWLPNTSIKDVILGDISNHRIDLKWYYEVIDACALRADIDSLPEKDMTRIGSRGLNLSGGQRQRVALARALYAKCDILVLDDPFSALDGATESYIVQNLLGPKGIFKKMNTTIFLVTNDAQYFSLADQTIILGDATIQASVTWEEMKNMGATISKLIPKKNQEKSTSIIGQDLTASRPFDQAAEDAALDLSRKSGDIGLYHYYFDSVGMSNLIIMTVCVVLYAFFLTFSQYWLKWWTESTSGQMWVYIGGYFVIMAIAWAATSIQMWSVQIKMAPQSGAHLHNKLLSAIAAAPLAYYSQTDIGIILNRFSQDIQLVDKQVPVALNNLAVQIFKLLVQIVLLLGVQKFMTATLPVCVGIIYVIQKVYLRTSKQLRYIELESRSAVYASFLETVEGITTIRAFAWQSAFQATNTHHLDNSQRPLYLLLCLQRWLNVVLDLLIAGIAVCIIALAVTLRGSTSGAQIGVALNLIIVANTTLLKLVESWTTMEVSLGAIARLRDTIKDTPQENKEWEVLRPPEDWPQAGMVEVKDISVSYNYNSTYLALKNVSLTVKAGQRLLICGRTGSGKSTLILTLLHLLDLKAGTITIDNLDISLIPRSVLRERAFIVVPQDPFIDPTSSVRFNLDPTGTLQDSELLLALDKTHLHHHFSSDRLDTKLSELPPLSTGQVQLFSLARAILRRRVLNRSKPILILDEAAASLDPETEAVMEDVVQKEFLDECHAAISISHRVSTREVGDVATIRIDNGCVVDVEETQE